MKQELEAAAAPKSRTRQTFTPISTNVDCLFFMKTTSPVDPSLLVSKMCEDAKACPDPMQRKTKYVNRLTPVTGTDKATEAGIERLAREVMAPWFALKPVSEAEVEKTEDDRIPASTVCHMRGSRLGSQSDIRTVRYSTQRSELQIVQVLGDHQHDC